MAEQTRVHVDALVLAAAQQLGELRDLYEGSLTAKAVSVELQVKIKNILENQRSAFEFVAHGIVEAVGKRGARSYFTVAPDAAAFPASFERTMPGVSQARPDIRAALENHQPYQPGHEWLRHLVDLTNENKHQRLSAQERAETAHIAPGAGGGAFGLAGGPRIELGPGTSIQMGPGTSISFGGPGTPFARNITTTVYVPGIGSQLRG